MGAPAWRVDLGRVPYGDAWALQRALVARRIAGLLPDTLLLLEHDPVVTLGRKVRGEARASAGIPVFEIERGGDLTYHGPGQLVGYPIVLLPEPRRDLGRYLRDLEEIVIRAIGRFGVRGERRAGWTGVWVGERKIASLGIAVKRWVTYHGFALNVTDEPLAAFRKLNPCGLPGAVMTSLESCAQPAPSLAEVTDVIAHEAGVVLGLALETRPAPELLRLVSL